MLSVQNNNNKKQKNDKSIQRLLISALKCNLIMAGLEGLTSFKELQLMTLLHCPNFTLEVAPWFLLWTAAERDMTPTKWRFGFHWRQLSIVSFQMHHSGAVRQRGNKIYFNRTPQRATAVHFPKYAWAAEGSLGNSGTWYQKTNITEMHRICLLLFMCS